LAEQNINTNITATANFSALTAQLQAVTSELVKLQATTIGLNKNLSNQVGVMNKSFAETLRSTGQFSTHFVTLTSDVEKFGKNLDSGRMKLGQYFNTWQQHANKTSSIVKDLAKQQVLMEQAIIQPLGKNAQGLMQYNVHIAQGLDEIKNKTALARQEAAIMNKVIQQGANQMINWGKNTQWAGRQLTVGLTVPMAAFGAAAAKAFREADAELVRLTKVYGGLSAKSAEELKKVREDVSATAKELASSYGVSYKETIGLAADIAATGKEGNDLIQSTIQTSRLAVLGEVDRQEAMKATLAIQNAFKQNTEELTQSIDFLNAVENQTSTTLDDLVTAIPKAGPVVKALGGDVKDLALYLTAMKEGGINASEGANAIKSAMASLINPTNVAIEMFQGFGIDLGGIVQKNAGDLTGTILALQSSLDSLDPLSKSKAIEQLFGKFQFARMSALFDNLGKSGSQTLQVMDLMKASTTDLANISQRELSQLTESASGKYKRALESVRADMAAVGESFLKISTFVLETISAIVKFVDKLPGPVKSLLTLMGGLTALAGPLLMLTGVLANFFGYVIKGVFHLKNLFKGGDGFKLLTPEIMAASKAGTLLEQSFYSDAKASATLKDAVYSLAQSFDVLKDKALSSSVAVSASFSTMQGNPSVMQTGAARAAQGERMADKNHPLIGKPYARQMAHMIPAATEQPGTIFGTVPNPGPVNVRIGKNPQMYATGDMPKINGLTAINGVSTGVVAEEAARWHAMTAAIATQSEAELALLKKEISATGTITASLSDAYSAMLPPMMELTTLAAAESKMIVSELQAGKITVEQARSKIIQLNLVIEKMMAESATLAAGGMGRGINLTTVPLTGQSVIGPGGKSNMKELFHKGSTASTIDAIARNLGVRTSGGGFSIETTKPRGLNEGGRVYDPSRDGNVVPGNTSINYDNTPALLQEGGFILNQDASKNNKPLVDIAVQSLNPGGKVVPALLTPGETYFPPELAQTMMPTLEWANNGNKVEPYALGGTVMSSKNNYGRLTGLHSPLKFGATISDLKKMVPGFKPRKNATGKDVWMTKPATGLHSKDSGNVNDLMKDGARGASVKDYLKGLRNYTRSRKGLLGGSKRSIYGSSDEFLSAVPSRLMSRGERKALAIEIENAYLARLTEMEAKGTLITDRNNPYHPVSNSIINKYIKESGNKTLAKLWKQFKVSTSSVDKYTGPERGASTSPQKIKLSADGYEITIPTLEGDASRGEKFLHSANMDWARAAQKNSGGALGGKVHIGKFGYGGLPPRLTKESMGWRSWRQDGVGPDVQEAQARQFAKYPNGQIPTTGLPAREAKYPMPRSYYQDLANQDPLHGPLQIGKYRGPVQVRNQHVAPQIVYKGGSGYMKMSGAKAFDLGDVESRAKSALYNYMMGDYGAINDPAVQQHLSSIRTKFTGRLHRGVRNPQSLPPVLHELIKEGRWSEMVGKEFIMRRSSWSKNKDTADGFGQLQIIADVKNRNAVAASEIFPDLTFQSPRGPVKVNESEVYMGGKFRVVSAEKNKIQVEAVYDAAREKGGPVNAGRPYLVGEKGPEIFVPKNSGGIIPGYNAGGEIGKLLGSGLLSSAGFMGGNMLGSMVGGDMGGMIGGMLAAQMLGGLPYMRKGKSGGDGADIAGDAASKLPSKFTKSFPAMEKMSAKLAGLGANGGKFAGVLARVGGVLSKLPLLLNPVGIGIGIVTAAVALGIKRWSDHNEHLRIGMTQYSLTGEAAQKAGLKFTDYNQKMKTTIQDAKALKDANGLVYDSMMSAKQPIEMTIEEYKKLKKEVKATYADQIKLINQTSGKGNLQNVATDLKAQLIAAGLSADEATKKIYAMFKVSEKGSEALASTVKNSAFNNITDAQTTARYSVTAYARSSKQGGREGAGNVQTAMTAMDTAVQEAIDKSRKAANEDKSGKKEVLTQLQAELQVTNEVNKAKDKGVTITEQTLVELEKTNPYIREFASTQDTVISLWQKIRLQTQGYAGDLSRLNAEQVAGLVSAGNSMQTSIETANQNGLLKKQYDHLGDLEKKQKSLMAAAKGQSAASQIKTRDAIKALQKEIDLNNKLADARLKALDVAKTEGDLAREIEKAKLGYNQAVATGDTAKAQQYQIDIKGYQSTMQYNSQVSAIENARDAANVKPQSKIDALNAKDQKINDNAAIASEGLSKLNDSIATQRKEIDNVNGSMLALAINAFAAGKDIETYVKESKAAQKQAAVVSNNLKVAGVKVKDGMDAVESAVSQFADPKNGIMSQIADGLKNAKIENLFITGNSVKLSSEGSSTGYVKTAAGESFGVDAVKFERKDGNLKAVSEKAATGKQTRQYTAANGAQYWIFEYAGKTYAVEKDGGKRTHSFKNNEVGPVVKAGKGTMKLNPRVPTIVGDEGPEIAYRNMIIPNISSIPYASPKFDIKKANLSPVGSSSGGAQTLNYTQHIHATPGMNEDQLVRKASEAAVKIFQSVTKNNVKMVGESKNIKVASK
jgi:TP901 family phage tail tape measure protein